MSIEPRTPIIPEELFLKAKTLSEALPWFKEAYGTTVIIKYGGAAMVDDELRKSVVSDIVLMKLVGLNPVVVHGGGNDISAMMERFDIPVEFKNGMRVTSKEAMEIVRMVLVGKVNQEIVSALNTHGHFAVGLSGSDGNTIQASQLSQDLGCVGKVEHIDTKLIKNLVDDGFIPVIASVAAGGDGATFNVNADSAAGAIAQALKAEKIIFLTDVDGLYKDFDDKTSLISAMSLQEARDLIDSGELSKGMIPKINACVEALCGGASKAHILNGTITHSLLLEIFTDEGVGTMITPNGGACHPEMIMHDQDNVSPSIDSSVGSDQVNSRPVG